ncbi:hypothetical protein NTE_03268 [Candidatus Nitrososphaera evergladensis SR1]|uniref:Uncharacterized protein n=1 Tax=Candidatus Nitrososphaera evergladensis SR1 TaxID=1459636 RepID=A0A075MXF4_9ARCH|nr:hypothetical protein [Candidatus Nitrososphaera evergladensis]AIF85297.1 hypothetical protein NTE_03268 [Candidatus Nitrososphaera evergladensis SR1]
MSRIYEIHRYRGDEFQYVVARTNKHSEDYVKADVEKMNALLSPEMRAEGIRYVFALGTVDGMNKKTGERAKKKEKQEKQQQQDGAQVQLSPAN